MSPVEGRRLDRRGWAVVLAIGIFAAAMVLPSLWLFWKFKDQPLQPLHATTATVVRIDPTVGRSDRQTLTVRNAHGIGRISLLIGSFHCRVGDVVPVDQRGTSLIGKPSTCR